MMHVLPCARVREDLAEYHDGELSIDQQILIQSHLQECIACRLESAALVDLGNALRTMAGAVPGRSTGETDQIIAGVIERVRVEQQLSLTSQIKALFDDMHLVWAGLGASFAMLFCVFASAGVLQAASQERPDSLAGIINTIATAEGGDPVRLAGTMFENTALLDSTEAMQATGHEADLMLSAMVTRDGRIQNLELLEEQARVLRVKPEVVLAMLDAASRARFEPVLSGGLPVAVNVVWLVTSTTVRGRADFDLYLMRPPGGAQPANGPLPQKRTPPSATVKPPTAGDDDGIFAAA